MPRNNINKYVRIFSKSQQFFYVVYMYDMADMISQICHLYLEQYYIEQKLDLNFRHLC